jgi:lactaldehyde dehydrogenase/glycolaldehyde dehydrogenase
VCREIRFRETFINRENFEAMQGFNAGLRKSGIGGTDGKHGLYEFCTRMSSACIRTDDSSGR